MNETPDLFEWAEKQAADRMSVPEAAAEEVASEDFWNTPVVLVDAFSQIFRAFYAIRQLNNHRGDPVNALYVMTKLLLQIEKNYPAEKGAFLFD